jgi:hypothetical protein
MSRTEFSPICPPMHCRGYVQALTCYTLNVPQTWGAPGNLDRLSRFGRITYRLCGLEFGGAGPEGVVQSADHLDALATQDGLT